jgi:hypothetical protein
MDFLLQQVQDRHACLCWTVSPDIIKFWWLKRKEKKKHLSHHGKTNAYTRIPFSLKNVGDTFKRAMDHEFNRLIGNFMVDYQDDLTMHSSKREDHIHHLRKVFERCRSYDVSLNPKKCLFVMTQGKLLGHIVCKEGIYIDPERVKAINELNPQTSKKGVQSFFGKLILFKDLSLITQASLNPSIYC